MLRTTPATPPWLSTENGEIKVKKDWEIKKLGDVCEVIAGQSPEGKFYNQDKKGTPFYQGKKDFGLKYLDEPTVWTTVETKIALENDILMSVRAPVGDINICTSRVCIGRGLAAIRGSEAINNDFLFYFLLSIKAKITGKEGAVFASINRQEIAALQIPVPPLEEQKRIVKILDEKFAQLETIKTNAQNNLQNAKDLFQSQLTKAFSNTTWEKKRLGEVFEMVRGPFGGSLKKDCFKPEGYPVYEQQNAIYSRFTFRYFIDEIKYKEMFRFTVKPGDFIMSCSGTMGKVSVVPKTAPIGIINQALLKMTPIKMFETSYIKYYMNSPSFMESLLKDAQGAAIQNVASVKILKEILIPLPPLPEQKRIVEELDTLSEKVRQLQEIYTKQIANCDELKQSLLQKAFEGEL